MYNIVESKKLLKELYLWQDYGEKHCESVFTKWHISFYLFEKFGYDKRKAHFSSLINSGQMTRAQAMKKLQESPEYPKLGIEDKAMKYTKRRHEDFPMDKWYERISKIIRFFRKWKF